MKFFLLVNVKMPPVVNVKMPPVVGILTFMSRKNNVIGLTEPEKY